MLENVVYDPDTHRVDFHDTSITQNTRGAYPIEFIRNAKIPCVAGHPTDVIFLTCDAFGVLPPVSKLTPAQAMYHFISGYTAKVAGTEMGVTEPQATFSPCFGGPFLVWRPAKYAELLAAKMQQHKANAWLVNTGWSGGAYGVGSRMKLKLTRAIINAIHSGELAQAETARDPVFGFAVPTACPGVPAEILDSAQHLERQGQLRRHGPQAGRPVPRQLREICRRREPGSAGRRSDGEMSPLRSNQRESTVKYMVEFRLKPGSKSKAVEYFESRGPNRNPGVTFRGAWIGKDSDVVFVLVESEDESLVTSAGKSWGEIGTHQATAVLDIQQY